jgi:alkylation response protein AidB-like acyl-CoA dehydrogenase
MPHFLTEEQRSIRDMARKFAAAELAPHAATWDEEHHFPVEAMRKAAKLGFAAVYINPDFGGVGLSRLEGALVTEALAYGDVPTAAYLSIHAMCAWMVDAFGAEALKKKFLPKLASMEMVASYCLTEPGSGSDAGALRTKAVKDGGDYVLNGSKAFISGASVSDLYVVMVRTGEDGPKGISCVLVEKGAKGLSFGALEKKMGWNNHPTAIVNFDHVRIPQTNRVGEEGQGFKIAMQGLDGGRLGIAACSLGGAQFAFDTALAYVKERKQFGQRIADFQATQFKLADMATELEAARLLLYEAAAKVGAKTADATPAAAMAKRFATDAGFRVANEALQLHGGYGYLKDYPLERIVRDLRVHQILEGTNEIMRVIIGKRLLKD